MEKYREYLHYGLYDPNYDKIKYVGITNRSLNCILQSHLRNPTNLFVKYWFKKLKLKNQKPLNKTNKKFHKSLVFGMNCCSKIVINFFRKKIK